MNEIPISRPGADSRSRVVGRFAPSPTGDLHMGSLMAAVASYLSVRAAGGQWLVRIEDVDRAREVKGAADRILFDLERLGFEWDGAVTRQSEPACQERYRDVLESLVAAGHAYPCTCSRKEVQQAGLRGVDGYRYNGRCRLAAHRGTGPRAWRLQVTDERLCYEDAIQGRQCQNLAQDVGDFVLLRADGCWAYQLAVVVDDAWQGVNQIVRGADLLDSTPRQIWLQRLLGYPEPGYWHIPVITNEQGEKLSKQTRAPALVRGGESAQLWQALQLLWQSPPESLRGESVRAVWEWAICNWRSEAIPARKGFPVVMDQAGGLSRGGPVRQAGHAM